MTTWNPEAYAKNSAGQQKWARELIAKLRLRPGERVLDVGCGDGKVTAELAAAVAGPQGHCGCAVGTDASAEMIGYARERFGRIPNLRFEVMDMRALTFAGEFDVVFSNAAMHWVVDHRPVLSGIARSLRPGGRTLLQMGGRGNIPNVLPVIEEVIAHPRWAAYFQHMPFPYGFHGVKEYRAWLEDAGLRPGRVELLEKQMEHVGEVGFAGWFRSTCMPWHHRVPEGQREAFIGEVAAEYVQRHPPGADGVVRQTMIRLEVEATRA